MLPLLLWMGDHIDNLIIKPMLCYCRWDNLATHSQCGASLSGSNIATTDLCVAHAYTILQSLWLITAMSDIEFLTLTTYVWLIHTALPRCSCVGRWARREAFVLACCQTRESWSSSSSSSSSSSWSTILFSFVVGVFASSRWRCFPFFRDVTFVLMVMSPRFFTNRLLSRLLWCKPSTSR